MRFVTLPDKIKAVIFDLDGVITDTATLHTAAWKSMFDDYLKEKSKEDNGSSKPFQDSDYRKYVDGKPRYDGVRDFLKSRHISIPEGNSDDSPEKETIRGLGNRKNQLYLKLLEEKGPKVYDTSVDFLRSLRADHLKTAIISSSKNCAEILRMTKTRDLFDAKVDGVDLEELKIPGKPDPAMFLEAAKRIRVRPEEAAVVEDALSGVEAGRRGGFGFVIGVARARNGRDLKKHGANVAVADLKELRVGREAGGKKKGGK